MLVHRWVQSEQLVASRDVPGALNRIIWRWYDLVQPFHARLNNGSAEMHFPIIRLDWDEQSNKQIFVSACGRKFLRDELLIPGHLICEEKPATAPLKLRKVPDDIRRKAEQFFPQGV